MQSRENASGCDTSEKHYNSVWHTDWHIMKGSAYERALSHHVSGRRLKVRGRGGPVHSGYTSENAVAVLRQATGRFGTPATILSDNAYRFVGMRRRNPKVYRKPTIFEEALLGRGIELINSRPYHSPDEREA